MDGPQHHHGLMIHMSRLFIDAISLAEPGHRQVALPADLVRTYLPTCTERPSRSPHTEEAPHQDSTLHPKSMKEATCSPHASMHSVPAMQLAPMHQPPCMDEPTSQPGPHQPCSEEDRVLQGRPHKSTCIGAAVQQGSPGLPECMGGPRDQTAEPSTPKTSLAPLEILLLNVIQDMGCAPWVRVRAAKSVYRTQTAPKQHPTHNLQSTAAPSASTHDGRERRKQASILHPREDEEEACALQGGECREHVSIVQQREDEEQASVREKRGRIEEAGIQPGKEVGESGMQTTTHPGGEAGVQSSRDLGRMCGDHVSIVQRREEEEEEHASALEERGCNEEASNQQGKGSGESGKQETTHARGEGGGEAITRIGREGGEEATTYPGCQRQGEASTHLGMGDGEQASISQQREDEGETSTLISPNQGAGGDQHAVHSTQYSRYSVLIEWSDSVDVAILKAVGIVLSTCYQRCVAGCHPLLRVSGMKAADATLRATALSRARGPEEKLLLTCLLHGSVASGISGLPFLIQLQWQAANEQLPESPNGHVRMVLASPRGVLLAIVVRWLPLYATCTGRMKSNKRGEASKQAASLRRGQRRKETVRLAVQFCQEIQERYSGAALVVPAISTSEVEGLEVVAEDSFKKERQKLVVQELLGGSVAFNPIRPLNQASALAGLSAPQPRARPPPGQGGKKGKKGKKGGGKKAWRGKPQPSAFLGLDVGIQDPHRSTTKVWASWRWAHSKAGMRS
eukprot:gene13615-19491_t